MEVGGGRRKGPSPQCLKCVDADVKLVSMLIDLIVQNPTATKSIHLAQKHLHFIYKIY